METRKVDCIVKTGRSEAHDRITSVGGEYQGKRWQHTQREAIDNIEAKRMSYYVDPPNGSRVKVTVGTLNGRKYLKTENDGEQPNNLLSLKSCS